MRFLPALLSTASLLLALPAPVVAQVTSGSPRVQGTGDVNRGDPVNVRSVTCSAGTCTEVPAGSTPSGAAGTPNSNVVTVQGISGGTAVTTSNATIGAVDDAAWTTGSGTVVSLLKTMATASQDTSPAAVTQSGSWSLSNLPSTLGAKANTTALGTVNPKSATSSSANVSGAASSTLLLAANTARNGCNILNDSTSVLRLKLATGASSTSFDYYMAGSSSGIPASFACPTDWTGVIYGIWDSATGAARVSERTN